MDTYKITRQDIRSAQNATVLYPGVTGPGDYAWNESRRTYEPVTPKPLTARQQPITFDDITSGFGIGGVGSDDYNVNTEHEGPHIPTGRPSRNGGGQLWEPCPRCGEEPVHLDCGYCDRHCQC